MPYVCNKIIKANKLDNLSLLPTIILYYTDGPRSGKQINRPPAYLGLPYCPLLPPTHSQSTDSPACSLWDDLVLWSQGHRTKGLPSLSSHVNILKQGLPLPSFWSLTTTPSWSCPFWLFIQVMPILIFPYFCLQMSSNLPTPPKSPQSCQPFQATTHFPSSHSSW